MPAHSLCEKPREGAVFLQVTVLLPVSFDTSDFSQTWNIDGHLGVVRSWSKHLTAFAFPKRSEPQMTAGRFLQHGEKLDVSLKARAVSSKTELWLNSNNYSLK